MTPAKPMLPTSPDIGFNRRPVAPEGSPDACLYLVGEAPGGKEAELGRPFVGSAGEALRDMMREAGIDFSRVRPGERDSLSPHRTVCPRPTA